MNDIIKVCNQYDDDEHFWGHSNIDVIIADIM